MVTSIRSAGSTTKALELMTEQIRQFVELSSAARKVGFQLWICTPLAITERFFAIFRCSVALLATLLAQDDALHYVRTVLTLHRYIDYELWDAVHDLFGDDALTIEAELFESAKRERELDKAIRAFLKGFWQAPFPFREINTCQEQLHQYKMKIIQTWFDDPG